MKGWITLFLATALTQSLLFSQSPLNRIYSLLDEEKYEEALSAADSLIQADGETRRNMQAKYYIYDAMGEKQKALEAALAAEKANPDKSPWDCIAVVESYLKLSDHKQAMAWLEKAAERGFKSFKTLDDSLYDPLRGSDGFTSLIVAIKSGIGIDAAAKEIEVTLLDGETFTLSSQKGKVVIIDFWATWCAPCREEIPNLKTLYENLHTKGLEIIGISLDNDKTKLNEYIREESLSWKFSYSGKAWKDPDARNYGVNSIPSIWIVDKKGILRDFDLRGDALETRVMELLKEN